MSRAYAILGLGFIILMAGTWFLVRSNESITSSSRSMPMALSLVSPAFAPGGLIPVRYTCEGGDSSPPLIIEGAPDGTKSLVLTMDDPDAPVGTWAHWVLYNIPPETTEIAENVAPPGTLIGLNSWNKNDYGGPCPPDKEHRYIFKLYALDTMLDLPPESTTKEILEETLQGHVLAEAELIGRYDKASR